MHSFQSLEPMVAPSGGQPYVRGNGGRYRDAPMKQETIVRIGAVGRRVPGIGKALDARQAERIRRWERRHGKQGDRRLQELLEHHQGRLNIGAGPSPLEGWINADLAHPDDDSGVIMDATQPWPIPDGTVAAINSEHFLEHIDPDAAAFYFREAFRVLCPGGAIRTSTPDLEGLAKAYLAADPELLELHHSHGYAARNHADMLNNYVYSWEHRHIYDFETIKLLLEQAGFEGIERVSFGESRHQTLDGVDRHDVGALAATVVAVDAVKAGRAARSA
jgi:predicted SAM-dependent methyltransferase